MALCCNGAKGARPCGFWYNTVMKDTELFCKTATLSLLLAGCFAATTVDACTAFVVGKKASATGHVIVGHNNDGFGPMRYAILPAADSAPPLQEAGRTGGLGGGKSPAIYWQAAYSDKARAGKATGDVLLNEHGVIMFSNSGGYLREWGAAHSAADPWQAGEDVVDGGLGLALRFEVVRRARSAAEGVKIATSLIDQYGYGPDARTFTIADRDEAWVLCAVHGRRYVARRCPDDAVMAYPNILPVGRILPGDIVSEGIKANRDTFDFAAAYQGVRTKHDPSQRHRIVEVYRIAAGVDVDERDPPWSVRPAHRVSADDLKRGFCSHAVGRDAENVHPEEVAGASWPICRLRSLENVVCQFAANPLETHVSLAPGRPCETKYDEFRPFMDAAPPYFATGAAAESLLAGRLLAPPRHADPAPGVRVALELRPGPDNPRNSEGAFVQLRDGRMMFAYSRYYGKSGSDHATADIAARYSSDDGATWTDKDDILVKNHGGMNVMSVSLLRLQSGEIVLFYLLKNSTSDCRPVMRRSFDEGKSWSEPAVCITDEVGYYVLNNDRVIQLKDGRLLFAVALHSFPDGRFDGKGVVMTYCSDDNGKTWRRGRSMLEIVAPDGTKHAAQEPGVVECGDGSVLMWIRTSAGSQFMCRSRDRGETFSPPQPSWLVSPVSPASIKRLPTGDLLAVWNDHELRFDRNAMKQTGQGWATGRRTPLSAALSSDDGATWHGAKTIEGDPKGHFCYIAIHPAGDGTVLLGYCAYDNLRHARLVKVPVDWFYGKIVPGNPGNP